VSDLTAKEQQNVRTTLKFLRVRTGAWLPVAKALGISHDAISKIANGNPVTTIMAFRVARLIEVGIDELLSGVTCRRASVATAATLRMTSPTRKRSFRTPRSRRASPCSTVA
jgi:hypothetical protein